MRIFARMTDPTAFLFEDLQLPCADLRPDALCNLLTGHLAGIEANSRAIRQVFMLLGASEKSKHTHPSVYFEEFYEKVFSKFEGVCLICPGELVIHGHSGNCLLEVKQESGAHAYIMLAIRKEREGMFNGCWVLDNLYPVQLRHSLIDI